MLTGQSDGGSSSIEIPPLPRNVEVCVTLTKTSCHTSMPLPSSHLEEQDLNESTAWVLLDTVLLEFWQRTSPKWALVLGMVMFQKCWGEDLSDFTPMCPTAACRLCCLGTLLTMLMVPKTTGGLLVLLIQGTCLYCF